MKKFIKTLTWIIVAISVLYLALDNTKLLKRSKKTYFSHEVYSK